MAKEEQLPSSASYFMAKQNFLVKRSNRFSTNAFGRVLKKY
jgi:hypothetical protein